MAKCTADIVSEASCGSFLLRECLTKQPYRTLWTIARANGCPFDTSMPKLQAVEKLTAFLSTPDYLSKVVSGLSVGATAALRTLQAMKGQMPQSDFVYQFGVLYSLPSSALISYVYEIIEGMSLPRRQRVIVRTRFYRCVTVPHP